MPRLYVPDYLGYWLLLTGRHAQYEALRRVHLIPAGEASEESESVNANVFRNLDSPVSEAGENFSTG